MVEEVKTEITTTSTESVPQVPATVQVSKEEVAKIEQTIATTDETAVTAAVEAGKQIEVQSTEIKALEKELADIKAANDVIIAKQEEEKKRAELEAEIRKQKAFSEQVNHKHVVPDSVNPVAPQAAQVPEPIIMTNSQKWDALEKTFKGGSSRLSHEKFLEGRPTAPPR